MCNEKCCRMNNNNFVWWMNFLHWFHLIQVFFFADVRYHIWIHGTILKRNSENVSLPSFISAAGKSKSVAHCEGGICFLSKRMITKNDDKAVLGEKQTCHTTRRSKAKMCLFVGSQLSRKIGGADGRMIEKLQSQLCSVSVQEIIIVHLKGRARSPVWQPHLPVSVKSLY